ncbi:MAG: MBL fold metallo-hydrolase [bacterium]|nr:MBL fold metallo-hydrolase [bacterium]
MTNPEIFTFPLGQFSCTVIQDEGAIQTASDIFKDIDKDVRNRVIGASTYNPEAMALSFNVLLITTPTQRVLIDTGNGVETGGDGRLLPHLAELGIGLDSIDMVILTHAHSDHYAAMLTTSGEKIFPNAQYVMWRDEWEFYSGAERLEFEKNRSQARYDFMQTYFLPLRDKLTLISADNPQVTDDISLVYAPGHSKHHVAVKIESNGQALLYASDAFIHPLHTENPDWKFYVEIDPDIAITSKKALLEMVTHSKMILMGYHFPFPGVGRMCRDADGVYKWTPYAKSESA